MIKVCGSQRRENIGSTGMKLFKKIDDDEVVLQSKDDKHKFEVWHKNDDYSGYVISINGVGYEFCSSVDGREV